VEPQGAIEIEPLNRWGGEPFNRLTV